MVVVKPFRGLRPIPEAAAEVAAPPYDVLSSAEARERAKNHPYSFVHVSKPEIDFEDPSVDSNDPRAHRKGAENLKRMMQSGTLKQDDRPSFYATRLRMGDRVQTGLYALVSTEEYSAGRIKKHEHTHPDKEEERAAHIDTLGAQTGPVYLMMRDRSDIQTLLRRFTEGKPVYDFIHDYGVEHTLWVIDDPAAVRELEASFLTVDALYIADGHHRAASAARVARMRRERNSDHTGQKDYEFFLSVIFPASELLILDYNRLVKDLNGFTEAAFFEAVGKTFDVRSVSGGGAPFRPNAPHEFGLFLGNAWHALYAKPGTFDSSDPIGVLDVSILQNNLLGPVLGIRDPRTDKRIEFIGGIRGLEGLETAVKSGRFAAAFALYPTAIDQLMAVADAGSVMPPKSTWFEPKLRSGLVVHLL
ncbi:MAG TPA: DUF1015 family protein [bacterium]